MFLLPFRCSSLFTRCDIVGLTPQLSGKIFNISENKGFQIYHLPRKSVAVNDYK